MSKAWAGRANLPMRMTCVKWADLSPSVQDACRQFLGYAKRPAHRPKAAEVLALCYRNLVGSPDRQLDDATFAAMEAARTEIMQKGSLEDQAALLNGMAWCADQTVSSFARAELQKRLMAGQIPPEARSAAYNMFAVQPGMPLPAAFTRFLLSRINTDDEDYGTRAQILQALVLTCVSPSNDAEG
ncbi:MAG TPA: hypothetical protein VM223_23425 [Planctomycetota bacterium]|nr:hypothetical protein [Planctomycetota bacterium]